MSSVSLIRNGLRTGAVIVFAALGIMSPCSSDPCDMTIPRVQVFGVRAHAKGLVAAQAVLRPSSRAVTTEPPAGRWWVALVGATTWQPPATFVEAGLAHGLGDDLDAHPYAASQVANEDYELVIDQRLILAQIPHTYRVERIASPGGWQASICDAPDRCRVLLTSDLLTATLPYSVIGAESNGIGWDVINVSGAQTRSDGAQPWRGWCYDSAQLLIRPYGAGYISVCERFAWRVTRSTDAPLAPAPE